MIEWKRKDMSVNAEDPEWTNKREFKPFLKKTHFEYEVKILIELTNYCNGHAINPKSP